jgi:hypothetical protein
VRHRAAGQHRCHAIGRKPERGADRGHARRHARPPSGSVRDHQLRNPAPRRGGRPASSEP